MALETPFLFATKIETPLMLAALVVLVLYMLFRSHLSKMQSVLVFVLALVAIVLSISARIYSDSVHPTRYWVEGYVYSPPLDEKNGLPRATVTMQILQNGGGLQERTTDEGGHYSFEIYKADFGRQVDLRAAIKGFKTSQPQEKTLGDSPGEVSFWLAPLPAVRDAGPPAAPEGAALVLNGVAQAQLPSCLNGDWPEKLAGGGDPPNPPHWTFGIQGGGLHIMRMDSFV
jgi:hypothetical protein